MVLILGYCLSIRAIAIGIIIAVVAVLLIHIDRKLVTPKNPIVDNHNFPLAIFITRFASHKSIPCLFNNAANVKPPIKR